MAREIWVPFKPISGLYEISNFGKVRSVTRQISYINNYGNTVYYTIFSSYIKIDESSTPIFRITTKCPETGIKTAHYFRLDNELKSHFGNNHYYVSPYNGVDAKRGRLTEEQKEHRRQKRKERKEKNLLAKPSVSPSIVIPPVPFTQVDELTKLREEVKRLKSVINTLLEKK